MKKIGISLLFILLLIPQFLRLADFEARENDSRLYTHFVKQLSEKPIHKVIGLEWQNMSPYQDPTNLYVRDHLVGQFIPSVILTKLGWDWRYAHYTVNQLYRFFIPWLFFIIFSRFASKQASLLVLASAHLNPMALNYGLRANQEQPLVFALALALWGYFNLEKLKGVSALYLGSAFAFWVKGLAGLSFFPFWGLHSLLNWKSRPKQLIYLIGLAFFLVLSALFYEQWFSAVTGFPFWEAYCKIQVFGRRSTEDVIAFSSIGYYLVRTMSYSLPWSIGLLFFFKNKVTRDEKEMISLLGIISVGVVLIFGYFGRRASRYIFPIYYFLAALGALGVSKKWKKNITLDGLNLHLILFWGIFLIQFLVYCYKGKTYTV